MGGLLGLNGAGDFLLPRLMGERAPALTSPGSLSRFPSQSLGDLRNVEDYAMKRVKKKGDKAKRRLDFSLLFS